MKPMQTTAGGGASRGLATMVPLGGSVRGRAGAKSAEPEPTEEEGAEQSQFLTFMVGGEVMAIAILPVREIIQYQRLTVVPMMPEAVRGVLNLRGAVVPVLDLASRLGRGVAEVKKSTCIVIIEVASGEGRQELGMIVDAVNQVLDIPENDVEPAPAFGGHIRNDFILGLGRVDGRFVVLLNADKVLSLEELAAAAEQTALLRNEGSSASTKAAPLTPPSG